MRVRALKRRVMRRVFQLVRTVFYQMVFGRHGPLTGKLTEVISSWEREQGKGDIPISRETWDAQYASGRWDFMKRLEELSHYSVIVGYLQHLKPGGSVLDIGCGEGIFFKRYRPYGYSRYLGIDISQTAIDKLCQEQDEKALFIRADAEQYVPSESFDAIVLTETLYYLHEPLEAVKRYVQALEKDGILVISTYVSSKRAVSILNRLKSRYAVLDEVKVTCDSRSWICTVFVPGKDPLSQA